MSIDFNADHALPSGNTTGILDYEDWAATGGIIATSALGSSASFLNSFTVTDLGGDTRLMTGLFDILPGKGAGSFDALLDLRCNHGTVCDFGNTSSISFGALPPGVTLQFDAPGFSARLADQPMGFRNRRAGR
jgi:hypothetical protein